MLDISVIILTYNEEIHLRRCLENVTRFTDKVFIVDSYSTDTTLDIAKEYGAQVFQNKWENNHAKQLNWGLENCPIKTKWVIRIDADEYLTDELIEEINTKVEDLPENVTGITLKRRHVFLGRWIKKGTYPAKILRIFQYKKAVCEQKLMDEHMQLLEGDNIEFESDFVDYNLNNLTWWIAKHNNYATREAVDLLNMEYHLFSDNDKLQIDNSKENKQKYQKLPLFWRSFAYFLYRYIVKGGFLEGKEGFLWHFLQGWWYRTLVDAKIFEVKKACGNDKKMIKKYISEKFNIRID